jgi:NAD dependent epimerase/dehydratase family enzyme
MTAFVTGATGTIGTHLLRGLDDDIVVTSRDPERARTAVKRGRTIRRDGESALPDDALVGVDVVYHLAGEPVADGRWTAEKKERITQSRVRSTRALVPRSTAFAW